MNCIIFVGSLLKSGNCQNTKDYHQYCSAKVIHVLQSSFYTAAWILSLIFPENVVCFPNQKFFCKTIVFLQDYCHVTYSAVNLVEKKLHCKM